MDARELQEFYLSNYESKFWGPGSPLVPITTLKLNHFMHAHQVLKTPELCEFLEIYWFVDGISGEVKLPGEWNYCWFRGKYYHLEKTKSDGFLPNGDDLEEWFFYTLVYDDWANEFLTNSVHVRGTISKTGDHKLVAQNLHLVSPLITEGNLVKFYNIEEQEKLIKTKDWGNDPGKVKEWDGGNVYDARPIQWNRYTLGDSLWEEGERADQPLNGFYQLLIFQSLEATLIRQLHKYVYENREGLRIYDVDRTKVLVNNFNTQFRRTGPLYAISRETDDIYHICKSINRGKRLKVENLRLGINWRDRVFLTPEFTPNHERGRFITKLGKVNKRGEKVWWTNKAWAVAWLVFRRFLKYDLTHAKQSEEEYNIRDLLELVHNQEPKAWRLGNRVHTVEELKRRSAAEASLHNPFAWYKTLKPYKKYGGGFFAGFDIGGFGNMAEVVTWKPQGSNPRGGYDFYYPVYDKRKRNWQFSGVIVDRSQGRAWRISETTSNKPTTPIFEPIYEDGDENLPGSGVRFVYQRDLISLIEISPWKRYLSKRLQQDNRDTIEFFEYNQGESNTFEEQGIGKISLIPEDNTVDIDWKNKTKERNNWSEQEYITKVKDWNTKVKKLAQGLTFTGTSVQMIPDKANELVGMLANGPLNEWQLTGDPPGFFMFNSWGPNLVPHFNFAKPLYELDVPAYRNDRVADAIVADLIQQTQDNPVIIDTTDFVAFCSIRNLEWHFELLIKDNSLLVENATCLRQIILGDKTEARAADQEPTVDEVITALNSTNTLNIYGNDVPLRDRFIPDGSDLDWNFHLSVLEDKYQADSNYYVLELQSPESVIRTILETPKEAVFAVSQWSAHDKRDTLLSYVNAQQNRYYEKANLELERKKFNEEMKTEEGWLWSGRKGQMVGLAIGIGVLLGGLFTGGATLIAGGALAAVGSQALGGFNMLTGWGQEDEERENRKRHFREQYEHKVKTMHNTHREAERAALANIRNMANANTYGNTTNVVNFQGFNKHMKTTDIHLRQTRPAGVLLDKLRWYYREYGYDLTLPDQWCFGVDSIRGHLQFTQILENSHPDATIRALIEARLLLGVRVVNLDGTPIGADEYPDSSLVATCLARYDQLDKLHTQLQTRAQELENERGQLQQERDRLQGEVSDLSQQLSDKNADITGLRETIEAKTLEIKTKDDRIRSITNQLNASKAGVETYRRWEKSVKEAVGVELTTNPTNTVNQIRKNREDLQACKTAKSEVEAAKAKAEAERTKAIEDARVKETEFNNAMREELNKRSGVEATLNRERAEHTKALEAKDRERTDALQAAAKDKADTIAAKDKEREDALSALRTQHTQEIEDLKRQHEEEGTKRLTCQQFRALAGHHFYDLGDQALIANIEKMGMVLAIVVKYMLLFNVDQRFGADHDFQAVFKDLYEIGENDLVGGFMDCFAAEDWYRNTAQKWLGTEWKGKIPTVQNRPRAEAQREQMLLQYVDHTNDGRLFRGSDWDVIKAAPVVRDDFNYAGVPNIDPVTKKPITFADLRAKAIQNITPANLNQLKELLDDLSVSLENATMNHLIDINTFDASGRSTKCVEAGALPSAHCDEVNFVRLCYAWLRFYKRIWPVVGDTDVPYGVIMTGITKAAEACDGLIDFSVVNHVKTSTIYPAIGLYAYNPRWASWSFGGLSIRHGTLSHYLQVMDGYSSSKAYDDIRPVIDGTAGIRIYNKGYTKNIGVTSYPGLFWAYFHYKQKGKELGQIEQIYIYLQPFSLSDYFDARAQFFNRAVQNLSAIFEEGKYTPQKVAIRTVVINYGKINHMGQTRDRPRVDIITLAENVQIEYIFGYETYKYALLHLLTMDLFRIHMVGPGFADGEDLQIVRVHSVGLVEGRAQPFTTWDQAKFIKYVQDQLKIHKVYKVSPDFPTAVDLFRWIYRNLKTWKDPTKDSNMEGLVRELMNT